MIWYFLIPQIIFFQLLTFQVISENQRKTQNWLFLSSAIVQILLFSLGRQILSGLAQHIGISPTPSNPPLNMPCHLHATGLLYNMHNKVKYRFSRPFSSSLHSIFRKRAFNFVPDTLECANARFNFVFWSINFKTLSFNFVLCHPFSSTAIQIRRSQ